MPLIPDDKTARRHRAPAPATPPPLLTLGVGPRAPDGPNATESGLTGGPVIQMLAWIEVPPEWLARAIPLNLDDPEEDAPCR